MSQPASERPEQFTTLEITVPRDEPEHAIALTGIANAYGFKIRERVSLASDLVRSDTPQSAIIDPADFLSISEDLFGTQNYGLTAQSFLNVEREIIAMDDIYSHESRDGQSTVVNSGQHAYLLPHNMDESRYKLVEYIGKTRNDLEARLTEEAFAKLWPRTTYPFTAPKIERAPDSEKYSKWVARVDDVTRDRLAHYLRSHSFDKRLIPGALGKAMDVLNLRAGLVEADDINAKWNSEPISRFVDYEALRKAAKDEGLTRHAKDAISREIGSSLYTMARDGVIPIYHPEVIVEGDVRLVCDPYFNVRFDYIALESLEHLFDKVPSTRFKASRAFIRSFIADFMEREREDQEFIDKHMPLAMEIA
ncbi:MAG: hypothetical protein ACREF7_03030, partial [Candidatus Saccharimonadales bacterium]